MDLLRPESSPRVKLLIDQEGGGGVGVDMPGTGEDVGGLIGFSYSLQNGVGPSAGTLKITNKALSGAVYESMGWQEDTGKDDIIDSPMLADHEFISKHLKSFGIVLYDGYGNHIEFSKLTATKLDYDDLTRFATAQIITMSFIDHRWKLEEHGVFLRCNCTVGNRFEKHWYSVDSVKPDGNPYTYRDVLEYLIKQIEISSFDGKVLLNSGDLPAEYKGDGMSHYAPDIFDVLGSNSALDREVSDIEWTGQPLSSCISDICGMVGLNFGMLSNGDVYFYKPVSYFGLPDFDFGIPDGSESESSGLISLSGGLEGPRVPESIVIVGARKRDQVRVFPSMNFSIPLAWKDPGGAWEKVIGRLDSGDRRREYGELPDSFRELSRWDPEEVGNYRDFMKRVMRERDLGRHTQSAEGVTAGMMPISEDWPSGKVKDLDVVAEKWGIDLEIFKIGYLGAKREKVLMRLIEEGKDAEHGKKLAAANIDLNDKIQSMYAKRDQILREFFQDEQRNPRGITENDWSDPDHKRLSREATEAVEKTDEYRDYMDALNERDNIMAAFEFSPGEHEFEVAAKKEIMASQWFRWYRLPDFVELHYDQDSIDARNDYIAEYPEHEAWTKNARPETTGTRGELKIREVWERWLGAPVDWAPGRGGMTTREGELERASGLVGDRPDDIVSESRLSDEQRSRMDKRLTPVVVPRYFVVPWTKELNIPYWTFISEDVESPNVIERLRRGDVEGIASRDFEEAKFPEPSRAEPFVWTFAMSRALYAAGFEQPIYPVLNKHRTIDTGRGYVLFNEDAPGPRAEAENCLLSENAPYEWPLVGVEFCYERKDPSLGVHNFYHYELDSDTAPAYIRDIINATPPHLRHKKYVKMNEFVEMLYEGVSMNREDLDELVMAAAPDIWKANVRGVHGSSQFSLAFLRAGAPNNKLSNISWSLDTGGVKTNITVGSETSGRTIEQILQAQINRFKRTEMLKTPFKYSFRASPSIADALTKGEGGFTALMPPSALGSWNDENLKLMNSCHTGLLSIYDENQDEDVLFCEAELIDDVIHKHRIDKVGPLLCKPASPVKGHIPIRGYVWWAEGEHKAGGHWYPYILYPIKYVTPNPAPDPIICSGSGPKRELPLPDDFPETGEGWFPPREACIAPAWYNYNQYDADLYPETGADMFPKRVPEKESRSAIPTGVYFPKERPYSVTFAGQWSTIEDGSGYTMRSADGNMVSAAAHLALTYNSKDKIDDSCARFRLYVATAYMGDPLDIDSIAGLTPDRIFTKDFTVPIRAGEEGVAKITGPIKLPPSITVNHSHYIAIVARLTGSPHDTYDGPIVLTDFKWATIEDTSEFVQEPSDYTVPYENMSAVCDSPQPLVYTITGIDPSTSTITVQGDASDALTTGYFLITNNMCQTGMYEVSSYNYDPATNTTTIVIDPAYNDFDPECPHTSGEITPFVAGGGVG